MLVLTRRINESILVGNDITITILEVDADRIKIGIEAPHSMKILRAELFAEVSNTNREAIQANMSFIKALSDKAGNKQSKDENKQGCE